MKKVILLLGLFSAPFFVFSQDDYCTCTDAEPSAFLFMVKEITKTLPPPINDKVNPFSFNDDWKEESQFLESPEFEVQDVAANPWNMQSLDQFDHQFSYDSKPDLRIRNSNRKGASKTKINSDDFEVEVEEPVLETVWETEVETIFNDVFASIESVDFSSDEDRNVIRGLENIPNIATGVNSKVEVTIEINDAYDGIEEQEELTEKIAIEAIPEPENEVDEEKVEEIQNLERDIAVEKNERILETKEEKTEEPTPPPIDFLDPEDDYKGEANTGRVNGERGSGYSPDRVRVKKKVKRFRIKSPRRTGKYKGKCPIF